eukprot:scaffold8079_cov444-Prasinococcus_capsulatus_cf.AAC.2
MVSSFHYSRVCPAHPVVWPTDLALGPSLKPPKPGCDSRQAEQLSSHLIQGPSMQQGRQSVMDRQDSA